MRLWASLHGGGPSSRVETGGSLKLTGQPHSQSTEFQVEWGHGSQKLKVESNLDTRNQLSCLYVRLHRRNKYMHHAWQATRSKHTTYKNKFIFIKASGSTRLIFGASCDSCLLRVYVGLHPMGKGEAYRCHVRNNVINACVCRVAFLLFASGHWCSLQ